MRVGHQELCFQLVMRQLRNHKQRRLRTVFKLVEKFTHSGLPGPAQCGSDRMPDLAKPLAYLRAGGEDGRCRPIGAFRCLPIPRSC